MGVTESFGATTSQEMRGIRTEVPTEAPTSLCFGLGTMRASKTIGALLAVVSFTAGANGSLRITRMSPSPVRFRWRFCDRDWFTQFDILSPWVFEGADPGYFWM